MNALTVKSGLFLKSGQLVSLVCALVFALVVHFIIGTLVGGHRTEQSRANASRIRFCCCTNSCLCVLFGFHLIRFSSAVFFVWCASALGLCQIFLQLYLAALFKAESLKTHLPSFCQISSGRTKWRRVGKVTVNGAKFQASFLFVSIFFPFP